MMYGNGSSILMHFGGGLLGIAFLTGLVFLCAWAIKHLKKNDLLKWAVLLLAIPMIGWVLAMAFGGFGQGQYDQNEGFQRGRGMMWGSHDCKGR
jgi:hypothetical protein